jgi:hypothetical protein
MPHRLVILVLLLLGLAAAMTAGEAGGRRPNVVIILADDLSRQDLGCYGARHGLTPNLDRLAARGLIHDRMWTPVAMCAPSRSALYTGLYPARNGAMANHSQIRPGISTLPQRLAPLGYTVVGEGLTVTPNPVAVVLRPGGRQQGQVDLRNAGSQGREWAVHVQGGLAAGGTVNAIARTIDNGTWCDPATNFTWPNSIDSIDLRTMGTADPNDDEFWIGDRRVREEGPDVLIRRRLSDWSSPGHRTTPVGTSWPVHRILTADLRDRLVIADPVAADSFRLRTYHAATLGLLETVTSTPAVPNAQVSAWSTNLMHAAGSFLSELRYFTAQGTLVGLGMAEFRDRDGMVQQVHPVLPSWTQAGVSTDRFGVDQAVFAHGAFWLVDRSQLPARSTVDVWRWTPGMPDLVKTVSVNPNGQSQDGLFGKIMRATEPGFLWLSEDQTLARVDTGLRPWLSVSRLRGDLVADGRDILTIAVDATGVPVGTCAATLVFAQSPHDLLPQLRIPVTLTVPATGQRIITVGTTTTGVTWEIDPAHGTATANGSTATFSGVLQGTNYTLQPVGSGDG